MLGTRGAWERASDGIGLNLKGFQCVVEIGGRNEVIR